MIFNYKSTDSDEVIKATFKTQRTVIGLLCLLLYPLSILCGLPAAGVNPPQWWHSISDTYYASSKGIMIGVLFLTAYYFFTYRGYDWRDRLINWISAFSALCVIIFPVHGTEGLIDFGKNLKLCFILHGISASVLFGSFFVNCIWLFCLGDTSNPQKRKRNIFYKCCGVGILIGIVILVMASTGLIHHGFVGVSEFIMLISYAFAWFVKSGMFLKDK